MVIHKFCVFWLGVRLALLELLVLAEVYLPLQEKYEDRQGRRKDLASINQIFEEANLRDHFPLGLELHSEPYLQIHHCIEVGLQ